MQSFAFMRAIRACQRPSATSINLRSISTTSPLLKRRGGNSAFAPKKSNYRPPENKKKNQKDIARHKTHEQSLQELRNGSLMNARNQELWRSMEQDETLQRELDEVHDYLENLGPEGDYIYEKEPTLADLDVSDVFHKLNAVARGDSDVQQEMEELEEHVVRELSVEDYNFALQVLAAKGEHTKANALLTRMEQNLAQYTHTDTQVSVGSASSTSGAVDEDLLNELSDIPHHVGPDTESYMFYLNALARTAQNDSSAPATAVRTIGRMKERGVIPDVTTYNAAMNVCAKAGRTTWAYNLMEKMQVAGLVPDQTSFTVLMQAAIDEGDVDKAFETFHLLRAHVADPNVYAFSVLIHGFAKIGRVERALNLLDDMLESGLTPSPVTFNTLINACAKSHYYAHKAIEFYQEMQELYDYIPDVVTYNTVLHACAKQGDVVQAEEVLGHMRKHQVPMDEITYNTMLNVYARSQMKKIVKKAPRNKPEPGPNQPIYQEPIEYDEQGRHVDLSRPFRETTSLENWNYDGTMDDEEGMELSEDEQKQMDAIVQSDKREYDELEQRPMDLTDFGRHQESNLEKAERLFAELQEDENVRVTTASLNSMLGVYANAMRHQRSRRFFENSYDELGLRRDKYTYRMIMQLFVRSKRIENAEAMYEELKKKYRDGDMKPDNVVLGMMVDLYARHNKLRRALVCLEEIEAMGVTLQEKHLKKVRRLSGRLEVYTDLIPERPDEVERAGSKSQLKHQRKVREEAIAYNRKVGKRFILPETV